MSKRMTEPEGPIRIDNKGNLIGPYDIGRYESVGNYAVPMSAPEDGKYPTLGDAYAASVVNNLGETQPHEQPADTEQPEYQHFGQAEPELTVAEQIQQQQYNQLVKPFEQLGFAPQDGEQPQDVSNGVGADASEDYYIKPSRYTDEDYGKELLKQLYLHNQDGTGDAFLTQNGYAAGEEGKIALIDYVKDTLGIENFSAYCDDLNKEWGKESTQHEISAPTTLRPGWEGPRGEKFYLQGLSRSQDIFGDSNSEDTIEYLKIINENTPIAGGISGIIDWFDNGELRMKTYTVEITAEDINKERVAQTESKIKNVAGLAGLIMNIASFYVSSKEFADSAGVTNDVFVDYGLENITGQVDTESICHAIADFLTPKISGNETYTREVTSVYCFTPNRLRGEGYNYYEMVFTFDYTPYSWHCAKVNHEEYYNDY